MLCFFWSAVSSRTQESIWCFAVGCCCRVSLYVPSPGKHSLLKFLFSRSGGYSDTFHFLCGRWNWAGQEVIAQVCLKSCGFPSKLWRPEAFMTNFVCWFSGAEERAVPPLVAQARAPQLWWRHSCDIEDKPAFTTATTYSTIDETLSPSMPHLQSLRSRHMRKDCVRSQLGLSSNQPCAESGEMPTRSAKFFCRC